MQISPGWRNAGERSFRIAKVVDTEQKGHHEDVVITLYLCRALSHQSGKEKAYFSFHYSQQIAFNPEATPTFN
jgi:hypothetical protein